MIGNFSKRFPRVHIHTHIAIMLTQKPIFHTRGSWVNDCLLCFLGTKLNANKPFLKIGRSLLGCFFIFENESKNQNYYFFLQPEFLVHPKTAQETTQTQSVLSELLKVILFGVITTHLPEPFSNNCDTWKATNRTTNIPPSHTS